jgi:hypothetical protein
MKVVRGIYVAFVAKIMKMLKNFVIKDLYPDKVIVLWSLDITINM